jgi:hypothetical protein
MDNVSILNIVVICVFLVAVAGFAPFIMLEMLSSVSMNDRSHSEVKERIKKRTSFLISVFLITNLCIIIMVIVSLI